MDLHEEWQHSIGEAHLQLHDPHVPLNLPLLLVNGTIHVMHVVVVALCCQLQVGDLNRQ